MATPLFFFFFKSYPKHISGFKKRCLLREIGANWLRHLWYFSYLLLIIFLFFSWKFKQKIFVGFYIVLHLLCLWFFRWVMACMFLNCDVVYIKSETWVNDSLFVVIIVEIFFFWGGGGGYPMKKKLYVLLFIYLFIFLFENCSSLSLSLCYLQILLTCDLVYLQVTYPWFQNLHFVHLRSSPLPTSHYR